MKKTLTLLLLALALVVQAQEEIPRPTGLVLDPTEEHQISWNYDFRYKDVLQGSWDLVHWSTWEGPFCLYAGKLRVYDPMLVPYRFFRVKRTAGSTWIDAECDGDQ